MILDIGLHDWIVRSFKRRGAEAVSSSWSRNRELQLETSRLKTLWTFFRKAPGGYTFEGEIPLDLRLYSLDEAIGSFAPAGRVPQGVGHVQAPAALR